MKSKEMNDRKTKQTGEDPLAEMEEEGVLEVDGEGAGTPEKDSTEASKDAGGAEDGPSSDPEIPVEDELETLQGELNRLQDKHLRLAAEFENYRKRVSGELASGWVRAQAELARSLLDGLDDLQRVSQFTAEDATLETLIEGVDLVERKLMKALTGAGLEAFDPTGELFDPNTMEGMMRVPTEEEGQDETVHQLFQKGYMFKDQLVRPARVSVYKDDD